MVKDFLRKLVALIAILFLCCLVFCPPATIFFSNEIVEVLFKNKVVWLFALVLALGSTKKKATPIRKVEENNNADRTLKVELHETQQIKEDDETLISPR